MPFQLSPGIAVTEKDLTSIVPAVSTSIGATVGVFPWGPVMEPVTVSSETDLVSRFGAPNDKNFKSFFSAANFLAYTNNLLLVRADTGSLNAVATLTGSITSVEISEPGSGYTVAPTVTLAAPDHQGGIQATATAVISNGSVTEVIITNGGSGYVGTPSVTFSAPETGVTAAGSSTTTELGIKIKNGQDYLTSFEQGGNLVGMWTAKYPGEQGNSLLVSMVDSATWSTSWDYAKKFDAAPGTSSYASSVGGSNDELHIIVVDADGNITGAAGTVLEKFSFVSKASDATLPDGTNNYYKDVINSQSKYIWWTDAPDEGTNWGTPASGKTFADLNQISTITLSGGTTEYAVTDGQKNNGFALLANSELYDISLVVAGDASTTVAQFIIDNVAETRKDCVAFISPSDVTSGQPIIGSSSDQATAVIAYRNALSSTSYAVLDSGYKYQYDRYNDKYRWVPLNADVAGLCARTDYTNDAWWSPAGLNRGQIKNVVRLSYNPNKTDRDTLYKSGVNPVVTFPGEGTVLFGDKTLLSRPSAFDRINVRRLFIVLEKAIATAAKFQLFEFNDSFTQAQFKNMVEPFLRDVQGRRGIIDFVVKCDASNNTPEIVDSNQFVGDIYIKPNRSINFITLNFIAARSGINFSEIGA